MSSRASTDCCRVSDRVPLGDTQVLGFRRNKVAHIGLFPGENFIVEILFPVDIGNAAFQFFYSLTQGILLRGKHFFPFRDRGCPFQAQTSFCQEEVGLQ